MAGLEVARQEEDCLACAARKFDDCVRILEPVLALLASGLVITDAVVFFHTVLPQVGDWL